MGWANCGTDSKGRPIGYAHSATCDHPGCGKAIDRGLSYACGGMHGEGGVKQDDYGCEGYFCTDHLFITDCPDQLCPACSAEYECDHPESEADALRDALSSYKAIQP